MVLSRHNEHIFSLFNMLAMPIMISSMVVVIGLFNAHAILRKVCELFIESSGV